jgi:hypothetical protein
MLILLYFWKGFKMASDTIRKHNSFLSVQAMHDNNEPPHIVKGDIGFTYAGAFAVWSILKEGKWQACPRKPKISETRTTMENY